MFDIFQWKNACTVSWASVCTEHASGCRLFMQQLGRLHTHAHTHTRTHKNTITHTHTHKNTQKHTQNHTHTHTHTHTQKENTHTHTQKHTKSHTLTHTQKKTRTHMNSCVTAASACSSVEDRYASLREAASTHSVLSVGVSCFQRAAAEIEVVRDEECHTTWSVSAFSVLLLSQVTMLVFVYTGVCNVAHMYVYSSISPGGGGGEWGRWGRQCAFCSFSCLIS